MAGNKVSESTRERETFKYDSVLVANSVRNDVANLIPSSSLRPCSDPAMTALAQVALLRLGASRAMISLFDCQHQHIIAEATPALRISAHANPPSSGSDSLWLCGTAIPRSYGICDRVLVSPEFGGPQQASLASELPVTVVSNLAENEEYRNTWYYKARPEHRFYAGVPIRTRRGIDIGVFCILDNEPRETLDEASLQVMRDVSASILGQMELTRSGDGRRPGERMVRGLGSYVEGKTTISGWQNSSTHAFNTDASTEEGSLNQTQQKIQNQRDNAVAAADTESISTPDTFVLESPSQNKPTSPFHPTDKTPHSVPTGEESRSQQLNQIFSKAANILRESIEVEGVLFLDAGIGSFAGRIRSGSLRRRSRTIPQRQLQRLLRRYPKGKIFNFDGYGVMASSDPASEDSAMAVFQAQKARSIQEGQRGDNQKSRKVNDPYSRKNEGMAIRDIFPGARSVAFVPLWDSHRDRWFSGCFVYTMTPTRIFTVQGELSYLAAFSAVIMADVAMMESSIVSLATTSLLSSLSHELRSPLHGIVLCAELLRDTALDVLQGDVLRSLEVCGRTLLDTINHLLDWTRINNFVKAPSGQSPNSGIAFVRGAQSNQRSGPTDGMMHITSNLDLDMLVEEVVECIHAGHTYQQQSLSLVHDDRPNEELNRDPFTRLDGMDVADSIKAGEKISNGAGPDAVLVMLDIDAAVDWAFHVESGALRRIIMNLCGNALKYTTRGYVKVSAYQDPPGQSRLRDRVVHIDITDTGAGIGQDYLNHRLFAPFAQENIHSSGAGLGLSLVRKFVRALGGSIHVQSKVGTGTRIAVKLPLEAVSVDSTETISDREEFQSQAIELSGLRVCINGFTPFGGGGSESQRWNSREFDERALLQKVCHDWLRMHVVDSLHNAEYLPDLILCDESHLETIANQPRDELSSPVVVVCRSAAVARSLDRSHRSQRKLNWGLFSFISRPVGPRKLAKAFVLCFRRWTKLQATAADRASISTRLDEPPTVSAAETDLVQHGSDDKDRGYFDIAPTLSPKKRRAHWNDDGTQTPLPSVPALQLPTIPQDQRFLLVEDNAINMRILQTYMKKMGVEYDSASDGLRALECYKAQEGCYKCILMDISMPVMDGFEATRQIRGFEKASDLPRRHIVAISGLASKDAQEDAFANGLDLFLSKPVQLKELSRILKSRGLI
ncbi:Sensor protein gacS [Fusarium oxysporum f. sp. cubense race 1]|uniref:Sensor protein gacS n=1 Tax=Fusarium oxysporum f. sp. cubense (strain race 1) TaxID=1229664 RepID=N4TMM3_FUSC1|nr:Sensor protein gacS [Fusarium oxysporum f. sp. cubense race 1]